MPSVVKWLMIVAVLAVGVLGMKWLKEHGPQPGKEPPVAVVPVVRVVEAHFKDRQLYVKTQGQVVPKIRTQAAAEVAGRVLAVSPKFNSGGSFEKGEVVLEIDDADYVVALARAESALADAKLALAREEARAAQARREWKKLGRGTASDLVLGIPQIASAKAKVKASEAGVEKAKRDLARTKLQAPYDCRVEKTYTDLGSYIMPGARLADLYSTGAFEVRVPVTLEEWGYLKKSEAGVLGGEVLLEAEIGGVKRKWDGVIVRSEGRVDRSTMTMYQVVAVHANENDLAFRFPPSGLFVRAQIKGRVMERVCVLPRSALRQDGTLLVLSADSTLQIVKVDVARTLEKNILVRGGISEGTQVIVSPMETPVVGMRLKKTSK